MFTVYTLEQADQWDKIVCSFKNYDVYWLSGYVKAFKINGDGEPLLFYFCDREKTTKAVNVVMKRNIKDVSQFNNLLDDDEYYDFSSPYGYGGWLIEGENTKQLFSDYERWCLRNNIVSEFVRFHPMIGNHESCTGFYDVVQLGEVVHIDLSSPEVIWENFVSTCRTRVRKAVKNGLKIYNGRYPEIYEKFRAVYDATMQKNNAEKYYYFGDDFYKSVLDDLPHNSQVFYAEKNGEVIAASIMLAANGRMNYHLSGALQEYSSLAATNLIMYTAALWGCANGCKTLYLGGGVGSGEDSLLRFKKTFYKGELNRFYIGKKIFIQEKYTKLVDLRTDIKESGFFPRYRG